MIELLTVSLSCLLFFFFSSRRRHTRYWRDWSSDVCSSDLLPEQRPDQDHALRGDVPRGRGGAAVPDHGRHESAAVDLPRRDLDADRGWRLFGHGAPARKPADDA